MFHFILQYYYTNIVNTSVVVTFLLSVNRKVGTFQECLMLVTQAFVDVPSTSSGYYWQLK